MLRPSLRLCFVGLLALAFPLSLWPVEPATTGNFAAAVALYKAHRYPDARVAFQDITRAEPRNAAACYYLGRIAMKRNDTRDAIEQFEKAVALDPDNSDYNMELGGAYGDAAGKGSLLDQLGYAKKCRIFLEKAVELNPDNLDARRGLVDFYRQAPSFLGGGVMKAYHEAEAIRSRDLFLGTLILGHLYVEDHRYEEAIGLFQELLQKQPDSYLGHYSIGRIAAESGRELDVGQQHLRRCLELTPAKDEPSHAAVYWRLGNICERLNEPAGARADYEQSLRLDPHFAQAAQSLAKLK